MTDIREQARQALDGDLVEPMALSCETIAEVEEMHARGIASMTDCTCNENGHLSTIHDLAIEEVPALLRTLRSRDALIAGLLAELERVTAFSLYQQVCRTLQAAPTETVEVAVRRVVAERDAALSTLQQVREPLRSLADVLAFSARDWGQARDLAWLWGILHGWDDDDPDLDAMSEQALLQGWDDHEVARLRSLHGIVARILDGGAS